jgi:hypothetical protein
MVTATGFADPDGLVVERAPVGVVEAPDVPAGVVVHEVLALRGLVRGGEYYIGRYTDPYIDRYTNRYTDRLLQRLLQRLLHRPLRA